MVRSKGERVGAHRFFCYLTYDCYHSNTKRYSLFVTYKLEQQEG